uniref:Amidohydrolase 3 domain-containing protein n=1 Tax=Aegilops tauschii subsp. strangulata TaxID=200361 RepID=A0A453GPD2_AEGTS
MAGKLHRQLFFHARRYRQLTVCVSVIQVSDIYPLQAIRTAMSRKLPGWEAPWISAERLPLDDSLKAHTISAAYACFLDHVLGSLVEGKYADFVVLPSTSWREFADDIPGHVLATYVNGKQAYP